MIQISSYVSGPLGNNGFLLVDEETREALVVDAPLESRSAADQIAAKKLHLKAIVITHGHFDHTAEAAYWKEKTGAPVFLHANDREWAEGGPRSSAMFGMSVPEFPAWEAAGEGREFSLGKSTVRLLHTPGHTQGGLTLHLADDGAGGAHLFTGDTLFAGSIGRTDLPGGDTAQLIRTIREKLLPLPDETKVYPGHGPFSTIGDERRENPFLGEEQPGFVKIR
jgi:glyoxylase-like metal-dependent hydrolase (beta-lactamase superfamily II)